MGSNHFGRVFFSSDSVFKFVKGASDFSRFFIELGILSSICDGKDDGDDHFEI